MNVSLVELIIFVLYDNRQKQLTKSGLRKNLLLLML